MGRKAEKVAAGGRVLDTYGPKDWDMKINRHILDIAYGTRCVLGQVYGSFEEGGRALCMAAMAEGKTLPIPSELGFNVERPLGLLRADVYGEWNELRQEWLAFLDERARERQQT